MKSEVAKDHSMNNTIVFNKNALLKDMSNQHLNPINNPRFNNSPSFQESAITPNEHDRTVDDYMD